MKDILIVANWKSNKTSKDTSSFLEELSKESKFPTNVKIVICPSYLSVSAASAFIKDKNLNIEIGVQDISPFGIGPYTGEVAAEQVIEFATFAIIGHSERRKYFGETDQMLADKALLAQSSGLTPIFCVTGEDILIPEGVKIVAYEPVGAIGTGHPDTPENADSVGQKIKEKNPNVEKVLYGGSVTADNVANFVNTLGIDGVLVGGASLSSESFLMLINKC